MAAETEQAIQQFTFDAETVEQGDRFHLDCEYGQIVIVITGIGERHAVGIATDREGKWCGPWGRIIFYKPITLGQKTDASFNQTGHVSRLEVVPTRLVRIRGTHCVRLLG